MALNIYRITEEGFFRILNGVQTLRTIDELVSEIIDVPTVPPGAGDISTIWQPALSFADWEMNGTQLQAGDNLATQALISLFSDRLATDDDEIPDGTDDRRGWWGDTGETVPIGSRLWLLDRAKLVSDTSLRCADYCKEALQWMIDDGVIAKVDVQTAILLPSMLAAQVAMYRHDGSRVAQNFAWVWKQVA